MAQTLRICMLNADLPVPAIHMNHATSTYGKIFHQYIHVSAQKRTPAINITSIDFNVVEGEYPTDLSEFDAFILSGSANSAYDDLEWIRTLYAFIQHVYKNEPRIKIFGSCFGHQLMCHALLHEYGVRVERNPSGLQVGVQEIALCREFRDSFRHGAGSDSIVPKSMRLQFVHGDHVHIPQGDALPPSWMTLGSTQHCAVQGMYESGRVLTFQGHFEFDRIVNGETIKFFFPTWEPKVLAKALEAVNLDDDSAAAVNMVLDFFMEKRGRDSETHEVIHGLLTPPSLE